MHHCIPCYSPNNCVAMITYKFVLHVTYILNGNIELNWWKSELQVIFCYLPAWVIQKTSRGEEHKTQSRLNYIYLHLPAITSMRCLILTSRYGLCSSCFHTSSKTSWVVSSSSRTSSNSKMSRFSNERMTLPKRTRQTTISQEL